MTEIDCKKKINMNVKILYYNENQIKSIENLFYQKKHGEVKSFYRSGNLKKIGYFFDDIPTHTHFEFHENQALKSKVSFFLGKKHGKLCEYNDQGVLLKKTVYRNGLKHGLHLERYPSGKIKKKNFYKDGLPVGQHICYYENDKKKAIVCFNKQNKPQGYLKYFYESGNLKSLSYYNKQGKLHGESFEYHDNQGMVKKFIQYDESKKINQILEYYENGALKSSLPLSNNNEKKHGMYYEFDRDGKPKQTITYEDGLRHGLLTNYQNGNKYETLNYYKDELDGFQCHLNTKGYYDYYLYFIEGLYVLKKNIKDESSACVVCYEQTKWKTSCNHCFCLNCAKKSFYTTKNVCCPYCRTTFKKTKDEKFMFYNIFPCC